MIKITIEGGDLPGNAVFEVEEIYFTEEEGCTSLRNWEKDKEKTIPNGQYRFCIKGWRGCKTYEDFIPYSEEIVDEPGAKERVPKKNGV